MKGSGFCQSLGLVLTFKKSQGSYSVTLDMLPEQPKGSKSCHTGAVNQHASRRKKEQPTYDECCLIPERRG